MSRNPFGWSLPPGVTDRMIDEAAGALEDDYSDVEQEEPVSAPIPFWTVAIYLVDRSYGGPEEGGWWFDCGERQDQPLADDEQSIINTLRVCRTEEEAHALAALVQAHLDATVNVGRRDIGSVISTGRYQAMVHPGHPPAHFPAVRPHYE